MKPIRLHAAARHETRQAAHFYDGRQPGLGRQWLEVVESAFQRIRRDPTIGRRDVAGTRRYRLARFPYFIIFIDKDDHVFVVTVMHERREPDYWKSRL